MTLRLFIITMVTAGTLTTNGCKQDMTLADYKAWLYSDNSGLSDSVVRNGRTYYFTILPSAFRTRMDSVDKRLTGLLRVVANDRVDADVTMDGVTSMEQHSNRVADLAFHIKDLTELQVDGKAVKAIGSMMPHAQGLRRSASVYITFPVTEEAVDNASICSITFEDEVFGEGHMVWQFKTDQLTSQPNITDSE